MNYKQILKKELRKIPLPEAESVLPEAAFQSKKKHVRYTKRSLGMMITVTLLACLLVVGSVAAIPELVRYLNARQVTDQSYKLTEVPAGWEGVYTLDDLEKLRSKDYQTANFILMNDIEIPNSAYEAGGRYEGGFTPLGTYTSLDENGSLHTAYYEGSFNGNGYVIRNLKLTATESLYGIDQYTSAGLFGYTSAKITYLGVEDVEINITKATPESNVYIGALAAKAGVVGGCYVKNVRVNFQAQSVDCQATSIGALCGYAEYVDACYVKDADVYVTDNGNGKIMLVGGIAGTSFSCVTSYFAGEVTVSADGFEQCVSDPISAMLYPAYMPVLLTEDAMELVKEKLKSSEIDDFYYKKFMTYYQRLDLDTAYKGSDEERAQRREEALLAYFEHLNSTSTALYSVDVGEVRCWYVLATDTSVDELATNSRLLVNAFGGAENFAVFCMENNIKCGQLYCYSFDNSTNITQENLTTFDFENLWKETRNGVILRAFED